LDKLEFEKLLALDSYLVERKTPTEAEHQLFLKEVDFYCPLCGTVLRSRRQKKQNKLYEIAHIYPNRPTQQQYETLLGLERMGENCESFENKIALCLNCHRTQDYHTSTEDYLALVSMKKQFLKRSSLEDIAHMSNIEDELSTVIHALATVSEERLAELNYEPVQIAKKFTSKEVLLKGKITRNVCSYFPLVRELFVSIEGKNGFLMEALSSQVRTCFLKMASTNTTKEDIFEKIVDWIYINTGRISKDASEIVASYFVQTCEVLYEISK